MNSELIPESLRLIQMTDLHLFANGGPPEDWCEECKDVDTAETLQAVLDEIQLTEPNFDAFIITGDIAQDTVPASYRRFEQMLSAESVPTFALPGNHDDLVMMRTTIGDTIQLCGHWHDDNWLLVFLDSSRLDSSAGRLQQTELDRLENLLVQYPGHHAAIFLHHHPVASGSAWLDQIGLENATQLQQLLQRFEQVKTVVFGHVHQQMDLQQSGVRWLGTPSTCVQFLPRQQQFALDSLPPAYRWLELLPGGDIRTGVRHLASVMKRSV